jgi:uncharacterized protein YxeA
MKKLLIEIVVLIIMALVIFTLTYKPPVSLTASAVENEAINTVEQEMEQAIANITEQDIENALIQ